MSDRWTWTAHLVDGTAVAEYDDAGVARGWAAVDGRAVRAIVLTPTAAGLPGPMVATVPEGATPVLFRRRTLTVQADGGAVVEQRTATCAGWEREGQGCYLVAFDDGAILLTADREGVM